MCTPFVLFVCFVCRRRAAEAVSGAGARKRVHLGGAALSVSARDGAVMSAVCLLVVRSGVVYAFIVCSEYVLFT